MSAEPSGTPAKADVSAAFLAKEAGQRREVHVVQGPVRLTDEALAELRSHLRDLEQRFAEPGGDGTWARALVVIADLEDRPPAPDHRNGR